MKEQSSKGAMLVIMIAAVILVAATVLWVVWSQNTIQHDFTAQTEVTPTPSEQRTATKADGASTIVENQYFKLQLPQGWSEDAGPYNGPTNDAAFTYKSNDGAAFTVVINVASFGGVGDASGSYKIVGNGLKLDRNLKFCKPGSSELCLYGDGKLKVFYSSAEKLKGNNYLFDVTNDSQESLVALGKIVDVIETIEAK